MASASVGLPPPPLPPPPEMPSVSDRLSTDTSKLPPVPVSVEVTPKAGWTEEDPSSTAASALPASGATVPTVPEAMDCPEAFRRS